MSQDSVRKLVALRAGSTGPQQADDIEALAVRAPTLVLTGSTSRQSYCQDLWIGRVQWVRLGVEFGILRVVVFRDDPGGDQFFALRTFRRDGSAASTPVWLAPAGGCWYGYTPGRSWKVARIRRAPRVEIAPSTFDGTPTGPWRSGSARELRTAKRAMTAKYGNKFRVFVITTLLGSLRKRGGRAVGVEISLDGGVSAGPEPSV